MIIPSSPVGSTPVAYSGGTRSTSQPAFGDALNAKLAELQAVTSGTPSHHHHDGSQGSGAVNQDAGNDPLASGLGTGSILG